MSHAMPVHDAAHPFASRSSRGGAGARRALRRAQLALAALALTFAGLLLASGRAHSTTVLWLDDDALIDHADQIVHGEVTSATSHWDPVSGRVYTAYTFRSFEVLKGAADQDGEVTFREWGGEIDGVRYLIPGAGRFRPGQEVLAFLGTVDPHTGVGFTAGLAQGKFSVERAGSRARAVRSLTSLVTVEADGATHHPHAGGDERELGTWLCRIRERCAR
jgi:hypothetical protein